MLEVGFRRRGALVAAWVLSAFTMLAVASPASAGTSSLNVDPTTVQAGGQITVSQYCDTESDDVTVGVSPGWSGQFGDPALPAIVQQSGITPVGGQWSTTLTIPASAAPGSYTVWGHCGERTYGQIELTVTPAPTTTVAPPTTEEATTTVAPPTTKTPTTTVAPSTTKGTTTTTPKHVAAPAQAVPGRPTYTG